VSEPRREGDGDLSESLVRHCNLVCDRFEAAWRAVATGGSRPLIESFLPNHTVQGQPLLLHELIYLDLHYRRLAGETCSAGEYLQRFGELDPGWLAEALRTEGVVNPHPTTLGSPASPATGSVVDPVVLGAPPSRTAPTPRYTRDRLYATGGIGQVWVARDHSIGRQVALKELRPDRASNTVLRARFLTEARITGQLEHPGIVPVYEAAWQPEDGEPFYTMRFVKGRTLREAAAAYHDKRKRGTAGPLDLRGLLDAFLSVCNVVAYAHSRGVLHRDLKGQNVVLGDYGEVFLLDWGLAKVMDPAEREFPAGTMVPAPPPPEGASASETAALSEGLVYLEDMSFEATAAGAVLGTPGYMAPEQAAAQSEHVNKRTDVYGLGAILYEVLTGRAPFPGQNLKAVLARVQNEPPAPPRDINPAVEPALQAICLKALSKAPEARFASAREIGRQVRCFLAGEPVPCYPDPWTTRLRRWMGRHRTLVTGVAAAVLVATVSLGVAGLFLKTASDRERASRLEAEDNLRLAQLIVDRYLVPISDDERLKSLGMERLRRDLLLQARKIYEQLAHRGAGVPSLQLPRARALHGLGLIEAQIGDRARAREYYEEALGILQDLKPGRSQALEAEDSLAQVARDLGVWHWRANQPPATARPYFDQALAIHRRQAGTPDASPAHRYQLAVTLHRFGLFAVNTGDAVGAREMLEDSARILEGLREQDAQAPAYLQTLASCYLTLSQANQRLDQYDQVQPLLEKCVQVRERLNATHPDVPTYQQEYGNTLMVLANWHGLHEDRAEQQRAVALLQQALRVFEKLASQHPDVPEYDKKRAAVMQQVAQRFVNAREPVPLKETLDSERPLLAKLGKEHADDPDYPALRLDFGLAEAVWHVQVGDHAGAASLLEQCQQQLAQGHFVRDVAGPAYFNITCYYSLAAEAAQADRKLTERARAEAADRYLARALGTLKQAQTAGFLVGPRTLASLKTDKDLTLLRARDDFHQWLRAFEARLAPRRQ
jgi:serine/threonine protein kinase